MEKRTKDNPWGLKTPPGTSEYQMWMDEKDGIEIIVCKVGSTILHYDARAIKDLHKMLKEHGDWMEMGSKDEKPATKEGTVGLSISVGLHSVVVPLMNQHRQWCAGATVWESKAPKRRQPRSRERLCA